MREADNLQKIWTQYVKNRHENTESSLHPPPAIMAACDSIVNSFLAAVHNAGNSFSGDTLAALCADMVMFGQYCTTQGENFSNYEQCDCGIIKDSDIAELLK